MSTEMLHYTVSGLKNVWLKNGFEWRETKHGRALSVHNVDELHQAIASEIVDYSTALSGDEFRFLRKELGMSQRSVSQVMGKSEQAVAMWEKAPHVPKSADIIMRAMYKSVRNCHVDFGALIERLNELDRAQVERELCMSDESGHWQRCA